MESKKIKNKPKLIGKRSKLEVTGGRECEAELEEGDQKAQTSSCRYNEQHDDYS